MYAMDSAKKVPPKRIKKTSIDIMSKAEANLLGMEGRVEFEEK